MKLHYLGTAAAEGWPALFCDCPACQRARAVGGRNIRTRSQALLDGRLMIDLPSDTYHHLLTAGLDISFLENILITHSHDDHWYPEELQYRAEDFASYQHPEQLRPLTVWGADGIRTDVERQMAKNRMKDSDRLRYRPIQPFETFEVDGYTVTALPANHDPNATPVIYQITDGKSTLLYGNDTGLPGEDVWQYWAAHPVHFDLLSLDCTRILNPGRDGHMGIPANEELVGRLRELGLADDRTQVVLNHFSHNGDGGLTYDELSAHVQPKGWLVSYDGMTIEF